MSAYFLFHEPTLGCYRDILAIAFESAEEEPRLDLVQYFRELRELAAAGDKKVLLNLARRLWAYGFAEAAAILVLAALPGAASRTLTMALCRSELSNHRRLPHWNIAQRTVYS
jgi:hypothetical protein